MIRNAVRTMRDNKKEKTILVIEDCFRSEKTKYNDEIFCMQPKYLTIKDFISLVKKLTDLDPRSISTTNISSQVRDYCLKKAE